MLSKQQYLESLGLRYNEGDGESAGAWIGEEGNRINDMEAFDRSYDQYVEQQYADKYLGGNTQGVQDIIGLDSMIDQMNNVAGTAFAGTTFTPERKEEILQAAGSGGFGNVTQLGDYLAPAELNTFNNWTQWADQQGDDMSIGDWLAQGFFTAATGALGGAALGGLGAGADAATAGLGELGSGTYMAADNLANATSLLSDTGGALGSGLAGTAGAGSSLLGETAFGLAGSGATTGITEGLNSLIEAGSGAGSAPVGGTTAPAYGELGSGSYMGAENLANATAMTSPTGGVIGSGLAGTAGAGAPLLGETALGIAGAGAGTAATTATPAATPATGTAISRILDGTATAADYLSVGGTGLGALLSSYGANQQADAYKDVANQYLALGEPYRTRLNESYAPGFSMADQPDFKNALDISSQSVLSKLSATGGNPYGNPGAMAEANKYVSGSLALPQLNTYRSQLGTFGQLGTNIAGANSTASAGQTQVQYTPIAGAIGNLTTPENKYQGEIAKILNSLKYQG